MDFLKEREKIMRARSEAVDNAIKEVLERNGYDVNEPIEEVLVKLVKDNKFILWREIKKDVVEVIFGDITDREKITLPRLEIKD